MDLIQAFLDGIAIAAIFNGTVASFVLINPRFFFDSYPKAIQKVALEPMTKREKKINTILTIIIVGICFVYSIVRLLHSGPRVNATALSCSLVTPALFKASCTTGTMFC